MNNPNDSTRKPTTEQPGALPSASAHSSAYRKRQAAVQNRILQEVEFNGGFSIFWATETDERARAIEMLEKHGRITRKRGRGWGRYPWCGYKLNTPNAKLTP